ncbi:hypothetical protein NDU88_004206, partial [Pleurodeles waltl]
MQTTAEGRTKRGSWGESQTDRSNPLDALGKARDGRGLGLMAAGSAEGGADLGAAEAKNTH